jgi:hypothetical protein
MPSDFRSVSELDFDADTQYAIQGYWLGPRMPYRLRLKHRVDDAIEWEECDVMVLAVAPMRGARRSAEKHYLVELDRDILWPDGIAGRCCRITDEGFWIDPIRPVCELGSVVAYLLLPMETPDDGMLFQFERVPTEP